jgi:hypothetical protein
MFVKSLESPDEYVATLQDASHPVVSVLQHLAALAHSHGAVLLARIHTRFVSSEA